MKNWIIAALVAVIAIGGTLAVLAEHVATIAVATIAVLIVAFACELVSAYLAQRERVVAGWDARMPRERQFGGGQGFGSPLPPKEYVQAWWVCIFVKPIPIKPLQFDGKYEAHPQIAWLQNEFGPLARGFGRLTLSAFVIAGIAFGANSITAFGT